MVLDMLEESNSGDPKELKVMVLKASSSNNINKSNGSRHTHRRR
jgi:hypothetical protein